MREQRAGPSLPAHITVQEDYLIGGEVDALCLRLCRFKRQYHVTDTPRWTAQMREQRAGPSLPAHITVQEDYLIGGEVDALCR